MIEQTATSGYECTGEIPVSISHGSVRRSRDNSDGKSSGAGKRRRFGASEDQEDVTFQLQYRFRRDVDVNFHENVVSAAVSAASDHVIDSSSVMYPIDGDSISDLKVKFLSETDIFKSSNEGFSRESSTSSVVSLESEEMESSSTSTQKTIEATSRRKVPTAEMMPSAAELEEFFSKAEKYEQKRFAEKYNFDIVKDVPTEGRYQWVPLPPLPPLPLKP